MSSFGRESWQDGGGSGPLKGGPRRLYGEILLCLGLELSFDADEPIQPSVEGTTATALRKSRDFVFPFWL